MYRPIYSFTSSNGKYYSFSNEISESEYNRLTFIEQQKFTKVSSISSSSDNYSLSSNNISSTIDLINTISSFDFGSSSSSSDNSSSFDFGGGSGGGAGSGGDW